MAILKEGKYTKSLLVTEGFLTIMNAAASCRNRAALTGYRCPPVALMRADINQ
jgi:hypothetical protein